MSDHHLVTEPIPKLIRELAIPSSIGFFFNTMYNVVDTLIAGRISTESLAALSFSFPIFFILIAMGAGVGMGATALIGTALGEDDNETAARYTKQVISYGVVLSILLTIAGLIFSPVLFKLLGATGTNFEIATTYMNVIFWGSIFIVLTSIFNAILNAVGDTKPFRNVLIASFFINLGLSPVLAFGWFGFPALGVLGIAIATVVTHVLGVLYLAYKVAKTGLLSCSCPEHYAQYLKPDWSSYKDITVQGFPAALGMMTISVGAFIITSFVSTFGEAAVAGYGVALRIEQIVLIPGIGINIAVLALVSQNNGAKKFDRIREIISTSVKYSLMLGTFAAVFLLVFSRYLIQFFTNDPDVIAQGILYLSFAAFIGWAYGILFVTDSVFRGLKRPNFPLFLGIARQAVLPLLVFWVATSIFGFGITGIWGGIFLVVWSSAIFAYFYMKHAVNKDCVTC